MRDDTTTEGGHHPMDPGEAASAAISEAVQYVRSVERLRTAIAAIGAANEAAKDVAAVDEGLLPELTAALEHLSEALLAFGRGAEFLDARLSVRVEQILASIGADDGE